MAILFLDLETELIDRGKLAPPPVAAAWSWNGAPPECGSIADFLPHLERALSDDTILVGQNVAFDMACLGHVVQIARLFAKYVAGQVQDVGLNEKLIRYALRGEAEAAYGLDDLCAIYNLPPVDKSDYWRLNFWRLRNVPRRDWPAGAAEYVLADADRPAKIFAAQYKTDAEWQKAFGSPILHLAAEEAYKAFALHLNACRGMYTDPARTLELRAVLRAALDKTRAVLIEAGLVRKDGSRDLKAAGAYVERVCAELGMPVLYTKGRKGKDGKRVPAVALGKDVLDAIPDDLLTAYSVYSQASTYVDRVEDMCQGFELPLQPRYNSMLETRRTSTSKPGAPLVGVQAQNFPRALLVGRGAKSAKHPKGEPIYAPVGARECLAPAPAGVTGFVFIQADLPTAELRSVSQQCIEWFGASRLADAINAGKDVHHMMGGSIASIAYEEMIAREKEPAIKLVRDQAKPANFGLWGGMGNTSFRAYAWKGYRQRFDADEADRIIGAWKRLWPEHAPYFDRASRAVNGGRMHRWRDKDTGEWREMKVAWVRHPGTGYWRGSCGFTQWCNTHFQERTGAAAARALCEVQRRCFSVPSSALYGCWVVMYTHDEIVAVAREEVAHEAAIELGDVMRDCFNELHPHVPIVAMDPVVARIYSKAMKPVKDPVSGRLLPWSPAEKKAA